MIVMQMNVCEYELLDVSLLSETRAKKILVKLDLVQTCISLLRGKKHG